MKQSCSHVFYRCPKDLRDSRGHCSLRRRPFVNIHPVRRVHLALPLPGDKVKIRKAMLRRRNARHVHGRSRKPQHFICFWITIKVFYCSPPPPHQTKRNAIGLGMAPNKEKGDHMPVSGGSLSIWSLPSTATPPAAVTIDLSVTFGR